MTHIVSRMLIITGLLLLATPAIADWYPEDGHKMHWPQLPDPDGWDIDIVAPNVVADDWMCTGSGPVRDIHLWFSVQQDGAGVPLDEIIGAVQFLRLSIHADIPADVSPTGYSMPGELLWEYYPPEVVIAPEPGVGDQGWASPAADPPVWERPDHDLFFQANIEDIRQPFIQEEGKIYWLDVSVGFDEGYQGPRLGWKTTFDDLQFNDDAVFLATDAAGATGWKELWEYGDPGGRSLDMAFVITPEPGTLAMLAGVATIGLIVLARRRRNNTA